MQKNNEQDERKINYFLDGLVNNLNLLKKFSIGIDKRLSDLELSIKKMEEPLNQLKKMMLE